MAQVCEFTTTANVQSYTYPVYVGNQIGDGTLRTFHRVPPKSRNHSDFVAQGRKSSQLEHKALYKPDAKSMTHGGKAGQALRYKEESTPDGESPG